MNAADLQARVVVRGPALPEPIEVLVVTKLGEMFKIDGSGLQTGQAPQRVFHPGQPEVERIAVERLVRGRSTSSRRVLLGGWMAGDETASGFLEEGVSRTPRVRVDGDRWVSVHLSLMDAFAQASFDPDNHGQIRRSVRPGDLVVLNEGESPRVRVVLDVRPGADGGKVVVFDPDDPDGERAFLSSRVRSLAWTGAGSRAAVSA
jgi:hypothetical protein